MQVKLIFKITLLSVLVFPCVIYAQNPALKPGSSAPFFKLKNIDNSVVSFDNYPIAKGFIIVFISNTCPYSKEYEQRMLDLDKKYSGLQFPVIAVNSNDPFISPGDSFTKMKKQAKEKHYTFPYLCDDAQVVADLYGARSTPQVFVVSKKESNYTVEYTGAIDNDVKDVNPAKVSYAEDAVVALLNNKKPPVTFTRAISCSISRRKK